MVLFFKKSKFEVAILFIVLSQGSVCTLYDDGKLLENCQKLLQNSWETSVICLVKMSGYPAMLCYVTDVLLGTWSLFTEQLF